MTEMPEADSEEYVAQHLDRIPGNPKLLARNYYNAGGILDILAQYESGDFLVIEVKSGTVSEWGVIQMLRYCGAIRGQLEVMGNEKRVRGLLVGKALDSRAQLIFRSLPEEFNFMRLEQFRKEC